MLSKRLKVTKIKGIEIRLDASWFFVVVFLTSILSTSYFPRAISYLSRTDISHINTIYKHMWIHWLLGFTASLLLFVSIVIHELAHSAVAQRFNVSVKSITLFFLGGIAEFTTPIKKPKDEFFIAVSGPVASLAIGILCFALSHLFFKFLPMVNSLFLYLAFSNIILFLFNLIPGYPMDGGRILSAILWKITGSKLKAVKISSIFGQMLASLAMFYGFIAIYNRNTFDGLWLVFLGYFVRGAAVKSRQHAFLEEEFKRGSKTVDIIDKHFCIVEREKALKDFIEETLFSKVFPYLIFQGREGACVMSFRDFVNYVKKVPLNEQVELTVGDFLNRYTKNRGYVKLSLSGSNPDLAELLKTFSKSEKTRYVLVKKGNSIVGIIDRNVFTDWASLKIKYGGYMEEIRDR